MFCPAKINLFLAVLGQRADGFHEILSLAAPLAFGDTLSLSPLKYGPSRLSAEGLALPLDDSNLCLKALAAFRSAFAPCGHWHIHVEKNIPIGSGLGGGSSNAAGVLKALNQHYEQPLKPEQLHALAATLGCDVPFFLNEGLQLMRGRGELLEPLPARWAKQFNKKPVTLFLPPIAISTPWAYNALRTEGTHYVSETVAHERLEAFLSSPAAPGTYNTFEAIAFKKYPQLQALVDWGLPEYSIQMSGSGSACFALGGHGEGKKGKGVTQVESWILGLRGASAP